MNVYVIGPIEGKADLFQYYLTTICQVADEYKSIELYGSEQIQEGWKWSSDNNLVIFNGNLLFPKEIPSDSSEKVIRGYQENIVNIISIFNQLVEQSQPKEKGENEVNKMMLTLGRSELSILMYTRQFIEYLGEDFVNEIVYPFLRQHCIPLIKWGPYLISYSAVCWEWVAKYFGPEAEIGDINAHLKDPNAYISAQRWTSEMSCVNCMKHVNQLTLWQDEDVSTMEKHWNGGLNLKFIVSNPSTLHTGKITGLLRHVDLKPYARVLWYMSKPQIYFVNNESGSRDIDQYSRRPFVFHIHSVKEKEVWVHHLSTSGCVNPFGQH